ncbi:hypothetical protein IAD21_00433 [Abditibacteriota bacterium]|nr:hypothetical protein IAD21_00433 [Abditibacteriota bacterium]
MAQGISIHIGLNSVDPEHYQGWEGRLRACENDARDMQTIAIGQGFESTLLLTEEATSAGVLKALAEAAIALSSGDILLITYSGHGGQIPDVNGDEDDNQDETWVLYDRMLVDDELYAMWSKFQPGVRIFMLSDSCHSGTVARFMSEGPGDEISALYRSLGLDFSSSKAIPADIAATTYGEHQSMYDSVQWSNFDGDRSLVTASVLLISGCQDNQTSLDGIRNGLFTANLLQIWANGHFNGGYYKFWQQIVSRMPLTQSPNYYTVGLANSEFEKEKPFTI